MADTDVSYPYSVADTDVGFNHYMADTDIGFSQNMADTDVGIRHHARCFITSPSGARGRDTSQWQASQSPSTLRLPIRARDQKLRHTPSARQE